MKLVFESPGQKVPCSAPDVCQAQAHTLAPAHERREEGTSVEMSVRRVIFYGKAPSCPRGRALNGVRCQRAFHS